MYTEKFLTHAHSYCSAHQTFFWWRSRCSHRRGLLKLPINKRVGLIIPACHVHQKALRSMGFLVIKAVDEKLRNKSNEKISFGCINPDFCFALFSLAHARHFYPVIRFDNRIP